MERSLANEEDYSTGKRQRKEVNYSDALTEKQFLKAIEDGRAEDLERGFVSTPRSARKRKGKRGANGDEEDETGSIFDEETPKPKKKRGRPPGSSLPPVSAKLSRKISRLINIVIDYRDR